MCIFSKIPCVFKVQKQTKITSHYKSQDYSHLIRDVAGETDTRVSNEGLEVVYVFSQ